MLFLKELGYRLFSLTYKIGSLFPIKRGRVFCVMTHDASETGNIMAMVSYMEKRGSYSFYYITSGERKRAKSGKIASAFDLLFVKPFKMATSSLILMDNAFLPMAFFKVRKKTGVIQLWHGTGSIKKFGQDSNTGKLKLWEERMNRNLDMLTVNAKTQIEQNRSAFGISAEKIVVTGLPRTDWLLQLVRDPSFPEKKKKIKEKIQAYLGERLEGRKILLYAPTFRDHETKDPRLHLNLTALLEGLSEDTVLLLRLHPFVSKAYRMKAQDRVYQVSDYPELNELLVISDALITDYSSMIFDYAIFERPMYFYADDVDDFAKEGRGFYLSYEKDLPGAFLHTEEALAKEISAYFENKEPSLYPDKRKAFLKEQYAYLDGQSAKRVFEQCVTPFVS